MEFNNNNKLNKYEENCNQTNKNNDHKNEIEKRNNHYDIFDPFFDGFFRFPNIKNEFKDMEKVMKTDVQENENNYELDIDLPGYEKQDIKLDLNNGYLSIEASKSESNNNKSNNYIRKERYYGSCARSFYVGNVNENMINANLDKGVLHIVIPKENSNKKHIEIK